MHPTIQFGEERQEGPRHLVGDVKGGQGLGGIEQMSNEGDQAIPGSRIGVLWLGGCLQPLSHVVGCETGGTRGLMEMQVCHSLPDFKVIGDGIIDIEWGYHRRDWVAWWGREFPCVEGTECVRDGGEVLS